MPDIRLLTKEEFADKRWQKIKSYSFMARDTVCPITVEELPKAMIDMPVGIVKSDNGFGLVALTGLRQEQNLFINPEGKWTSEYLPAVMRSYPFLLARVEENDEQLYFCVDVDSEFLSDDPDAELFYDEDGELTQQLKSILKLLEAIFVSRQVTERILKLLDELNLIKPWQLQIELDGQPHQLEGLYRIDESALNALSDEDFLKLRADNALAVAYAHLLSLQNIPSLRRRAESQPGSAGATTTEELNLDSFSGEGNINLDNI